MLRRLEALDQAPFDVTVLEHPAPLRAVLFAAGRGGDPARHAPLLEALHARGATVIAPHAELFANPRPTADQLLERARRLRDAVDALAPAAVPLHGVGHSIGATLLLALAGGQAWLGPALPLSLGTLPLETLCLMAPPLGFFLAPGSLDAVAARTTLWWGTADSLCPRAEVDAVLVRLGPKGVLRVAEGAGHFSFMHLPPPNAPEPLADRDAFLMALTAEVGASLDG